MNIYIPYVYLIGWSKLDKYYIGSRYSSTKGHGIANPSDLFVTYFTSSKIVKYFREVNGEPDVFLILKTFTDGTEAHHYETKILRRLNAKYHDRLLNTHNNNGYFGGPRSKELNAMHSHYMKTRTLPEDFGSKVSAGRKGIPSKRKGRTLSEETKRKMSVAQTGKKHTDEHRRKNSEAKMGKVDTEATRRKRSESAKIAWAKRKQTTMQ